MNLYGKDALYELELLLDTYNPGDIYILCPSINSKSVHILETFIHEELSHREIPICVITQDTVADSRVTHNKLVISSIHASKGLEREAIILMNFHQSKIERSPQGAAGTKLGCDHYVAQSRCLKQLVILHNYTNDFHPFVNQEKLKSKSYDWELIEYVPHKRSSGGSPRLDESMSVTQFIKHLPFSVISRCLAHITVHRINEADTKPIELEQFTHGRFGMESVSSINGVAIPAYAEYKLTGDSHIFREMFPFENVTPEKFNTQLLLCAATKKVSNDSDFEFLVHQIKQFKWVNRKTFEMCLDNLRRLNLSDSLNFEVHVKSPIMHGSIDLIDSGKNNIYELKCTSNLQDEHILQVALYMCIYTQHVNNPLVVFKYYLYNILNKELLQIKVSPFGQSHIVNILREHHKQKSTKGSSGEGDILN